MEKALPGKLSSSFVRFTTGESILSLSAKKNFLIATALLLIASCTVPALVSAQTKKQLWGMTEAGGQYGAGTIFTTDSVGTNEAVQYSFYQIAGENPYSTLIQATDGNFYGMTNYGGANNEGVLFQYNPSTLTCTDKVDFAGTSNGAYPYGSLMQASDGNLYGLTEDGGANNKGVLFQYNISTSVLTVEINFAGASNGQYPYYSSLIEASDGNLYGMTYGGGANNEGVLFQYNLSTSVLTTEINFAGTSNGEYPFGSLMQASDGNLYGMTYQGGANNDGVLFQYKLSTSVLTKEINFAGSSNGEYPVGSLMQASDGNLYGMTSGGGTNNYGVLFQYNLSTSVFTKEINFAGFSNGEYPDGSLMQASDGNLYGMTSGGGANGEGVLFQYNLSTSILTTEINFAGASNGSNPEGSLMQASDGNLYGLTTYGGSNFEGNLFQYNLSTSALTTEIKFGEAPNGANPYGSLMQASDGNLYGMIYGGGANYGGILFQYNLSTSVLTTEINFAGSNGANPYGSLIEASDGNLYGMTYEGGVNGDGVLFQYNLSTSVLTKKIDFAGSSNGESPFGSLMQASDGNLYGMTYQGGANNDGVLFQYNLSTSLLTKKIDFAGSSDGQNPFFGSLIQASDGNLYGMTENGGVNNDGVLFQYNLSTSVLTTEINFAGSSNGEYPDGSLMQASDGNLYGMTTDGGANGDGVLFQYNLSTSVLTNEINFAGTTNGANPYGNLIEITVSDLPIELLSFNAAYNGTAVDINWSTASEINNDFFTVEKSKDGNDFIPLIEVKGAGTSTTLLNYHAIDSNPYPGVSYYRLKQTDFNGRFTYSNIIGVYMNGKYALNIYPNPASATLSIHFTGSVEEQNMVSFYITDVTGRALYEASLTGGDNTIDVSKWNNGVYFYSATNDTQTMQGKFVVEK